MTGGQYDCGTTDVTRTFHLGEPSEHQKICFSCVLQASLFCSQARLQPRCKSKPENLGQHIFPVVELYKSVIETGGGWSMQEWMFCN